MENDAWLYNPDLCDRPGCVLPAEGVGFDSADFLASTTFDMSSIVFHGKLGFPNSIKKKVSEIEPLGLQLFASTFLLLRVSDAEERQSQIEEATRFLTFYQAEIRRLRCFRKVKSVSLKFTATNTQCRDELPVEFFNLTASCGIESVID